MFLAKPKVYPESQDAIKTESPSRHIQFLDELIDLDAIAGLPRRWKKNT